MQIRNLLLLIRLVLLDLGLDRVEYRNKQLVLLLNNLLVRSQPVQHVEVVILIDKSLSVQTVVILG